jgi:hypothetical protein
MNNKIRKNINRKKTNKKNLSAKILKPVLALTILATAASAHASIIINEIDYDQPGSDTTEFIELFNSGTEGIILDGYFIDLINGGNSSVYRSIDLTGFTIEPDNYFVVCNDVTQVANCNHAFTTNTGWIQNGAPDAVALYDGIGLLDSLSYEGDLPPFTEGSALTEVDSNSFIASISRLPNGIDTNNNLLDYKLGCITPGATNIGGTGDCSSLSPVPVPPAVLLFGSGLIGLVGFARRKNSLGA